MASLASCVLIEVKGFLPPEPVEKGFPINPPRYHAWGNEVGRRCLHGKTEQVMWRCEDSLAAREALLFRDMVGQ